MLFGSCDFIRGFWLPQMQTDAPAQDNRRLLRVFCAAENNGKDALPSRKLGRKDELHMERAEVEPKDPLSGSAGPCSTRLRPRLKTDYGMRGEQPAGSRLS